MVTHDRDLAKRATRTVMLSDGEIIEEYLVRAFPSLDEPQLIRATRHLERETFPAGSIILREGAPPDRLYIVTRGHVEVQVRAPDGDRRVVARMGRGQYFGEIELLRGGANIASIRADLETGVEVATLDRETFGNLVSESESTREAVQRLAEERIAENVNGRNGADRA
jgi:CRP-like cAMP-binding protein